MRGILLRQARTVILARSVSQVYSQYTLFVCSPDPALLSAGHHCIVLEAGRVAAQVRRSTVLYSVL